MTDGRPPIGIAGTGSVAQALGRLLYEGGEPVVAVASRTPSRANAAARFIGPTVQPASYAELASRATRILIATSDGEITPVAAMLAGAGLGQGIVLHTCGARGPEALSPLQAVGAACGVLHPLQTFVSPQQGLAALRHITFGIAGDLPAVEWGEQIAALLECRVVRPAAGEMASYHAGAVMASNAVVALADAAALLFGQAGIGYQAALQAIEPLYRTAVDNVFRLGPEAAATGPIVRGDAVTVAAHVAALAAAPPHLAALYRTVGHCLLDIARRRGLPEASLRTLAVALDACQAGDDDGSQSGSHA